MSRVTTSRECPIVKPPIKEIVVQGDNGTGSRKMVISQSKYGGSKAALWSPGDSRMAKPDGTGIEGGTFVSLTRDELRELAADLNQLADQLESTPC